MKIGIIGTGNMGRIMIEAFIDGKALSPSSIIMTNRTISKAVAIQKLYPEINIVHDVTDVAKEADLLFLCVKPGNMHDVIQEILPFLNKAQCVTSITSPLNTSLLASLLPCSTARAIPSITNRALAGVSLLTFSEQCEPQWQQYLIQLFEKISTPIIIDEDITRVSSDIVSCGPAFFTYLTRRFIDAAVSETNIDRETATKMAGEMLIGLGALLSKQFYTFESLQEKVSVKGGVTGEGIKVLEDELGAVFEHLFQATHVKFAEDLQEVNAAFATAEGQKSPRY
ncbi:late competence protein ComER [Robertmurraya sp. DFI.2.37]|uniref:late competence protein ComER n=1 Tax=Robertmurraya sp. DFI.2.37 TaxID=3031819 RepID=UPI0012473CF2|nr:late competence protein ComER [Robertmurraya sp. DFI.2.37]MDF1508286.1 late competence protein ComER [Robertmurraya sp. DFI.2.37]